MTRTEHIEQLNKELMKLLEGQDPRALDIIDELKRQGSESGDDNLLGYAYYRYAYYYYFTIQDMKKFRVYLQQAIRYLLKSDNKEYLAGAYNLVAYDAQDQGSFDIAHAYFMIALKTAEKEKDISLPALIESSAGRLMIELGNYEQGRDMMMSAVSKLESYSDSHVHNYNMIISYADVALSAFLMGDGEGVKNAFAKVEKYYEAANEKERRLSRTYYLLPQVYISMLAGDDDELETKWEELFVHWRGMTAADLVGLITEIEAMFSYMVEHDYIILAREMLSLASVLAESDNSAVAIRYHALEITYYEKIHDLKNLRECLRAQHNAKKRQKADTSRMRRYLMEFADMTEIIANDRRNQDNDIAS